MGTEVKSLRDGGASITDGFCQMYGNELWLEGIHIAEYGRGSWTNHAARRRRKLLMHRSELTKSLRSSRKAATPSCPSSSISARGAPR